MLTFVFRSACNNRACYHLAASFGCTASSGIQWGNKAAAIAHTIITQGSAHLAVSNLSRMIGAFMLFKGFSHFHANMDLPKRTKKNIKYFLSNAFRVAISSVRQGFGPFLCNLLCLVWVEAA